MKFLRNMLLAALLAIGLAPAALAQQAGVTPVQQSSSRLDACNAIGYGTAAVNTTVTVTIPALSGNYVYICGISIDVCGDATGTAATNLTFTSTNLPGSPTWQFSTTAALTAGACLNPPIKEFYATPLKSAAPGTSVVITSPAVLLHTAYTTRVYYYYAP